MAQFPSYIRNKLYQQHNPGSIFYKGSIFYNTCIIWTPMEYEPRVHFLWSIPYSMAHRIWIPIVYEPRSNLYGGPYNTYKMEPYRLLTWVHFLWVGPYSNSMAHIGYGPHRMWTSLGSNSMLGSIFYNRKK